MPVALAFHFCHLLQMEEKMIVGGGVTTLWSHSNAMVMLDLKTGLWSHLKRLPLQANHKNAIVVYDDIVVFYPRAGISFQYILASDKWKNVRGVFHPTEKNTGWTLINIEEAAVCN